MDVRGCLGTLHKESHSFYSNLFHSRALQLSISLSAGMGKRSGVLVPAKASDSKNLVCSGIVDLHTDAGYQKILSSNELEGLDDRCKPVGLEKLSIQGTWLSAD